MVDDDAPDTRRPVRVRRAMSLVMVLIGLAGAGVFGYPAVTDLLSRQRQHTLADQLDDPALRDAYRADQVRTGSALTRLRIPKLGVDVVVVEGTTAKALKAGAGHYADTPLPCQRGNVSIAGHRTTYGRPFRNIERLRRHDVVTLETPLEMCTYEVVGAVDGHPNPWPVAPSDVSVIGAPRDPRASLLTLTACHPVGSDRQRLVVRLRLVKHEPEPSG
jgi:sortase A